MKDEKLKPTERYSPSDAVKTFPTGYGEFDLCVSSFGVFKSLLKNFLRTSQFAYKYLNNNKFELVTAAK